MSINLCRVRQVVGAIVGSMLSLAAQAADSPPTVTVLRFPAGSAAIGPSGIRLLQRHAEFLRAHPKQRVRLEGHTDERGAAEFNLSIGNWRAERVQQALIRLGAPIGQINTFSHGEETPLARRHEPSAWRINRRVELIYEPEIAEEADGTEKTGFARSGSDGNETRR